MDKFFIFIIFLGPLVFFHELGHFLFARFFGVRVETFSIGFGPKIFSFTKGDTNYALSLIPLGGYVKMYGDNILERDEVPEEERAFAYTHKSVWQRFWIVFGGPLANFIMAFALFFFLYMNGESGRLAKIGLIEPDTTLSKLDVQAGDIVSEINGKKIMNINDFSSIEDAPSYSVKLNRSGDIVNKKLEMSKEELLTSLGRAMSYPLRQPIVVSKFGELFVISHQSSSIDWKQSLEDILNSSNNQIFWLIPISKDAKKNDQNIFDDQDLVFNKATKIVIAKSIFKDYFPADLSVKSLVMGAPADKAGIKASDVIFSVAGVELKSFFEMRALIQKNAPTGPIKIVMFSEGVRKVIELKAKLGEDGQSYQVGVYRRADFMAAPMVQSEAKGFIESIPLAFQRTIGAIKEVFMTFKLLVTAKASMKNLGGPIAIGKFAAASFYTGLTQFLAFMAMMSVNLGVINLFPIPVLDGGHIVFLGIEFINRGPVSKKVMSIAYQVGFSILIMMLGVALFNDISNLF